MVENDDFKKFLSIKTPVVVYNLDDLSRKLYELNQLIPEWVNVIYSVKANSNKKIIDFFKESNLIKGLRLLRFKNYKKLKSSMKRKYLLQVQVLVMIKLKNV